MEFSGYSFLFVFLPLVIGVYFLVKYLSNNNKTAKNIVLLIGSLLFYVWGGGFIFFGATLLYLLIIYFYGFIVNKLNLKIGIIIGVVLSLSYMIVFKILNATSNIALPLAISFICFQSCAYLVDVGRGKIVVEKNPINFFTYSLLFTKLVQGPIMNYQSIGEQLNNRTETWDDFSNGVIRFAFGLAKKVLIAGFIFTSLQKMDAAINEVSPGVVLLDLLFYSLYLYFDFSAYSDMAVGLSKMFGIKAIENFDYPYTATSITDFWRRWHISLSLWFKEYVYFPLGGSRKGKLRTLINVAIIFLLTGIWHGFNLNFLVWGIYFAVVMVIEKAFFANILNKNKLKFLNNIYVLIIVSFSWIFFRYSSLDQSIDFIKGIFVCENQVKYISQVITIKGIVGASLGILSVGYIQRLVKPKCEKFRDNKVCVVLTFVFALMLILASAFFMIAGTYSPSIYGGF